MNSNQCLRCEKNFKLDHYKCKNNHYPHILCFVCSGMTKCFQCQTKLQKCFLKDSLMKTRNNHFPSHITGSKQAQTNSRNIERHFKSNDCYKNKISPKLQQDSQPLKQPLTIINQPRTYTYNDNQYDSQYLKGKINQKFGQTYSKGTRIYEQNNNRKINDDKLKLLDEKYRKDPKYQYLYVFKKQKNQVDNLFKHKISYNQQKEPIQNDRMNSQLPINLNKDNYISSQKQSEPLTKQKQILQARQLIKIKKGYVHNGCQTIHKLYNLVKLLDESSVFSSDVLLPKCHKLLDKAFLIQIIKDKCLVCGHGKQSQCSVSYELKNGYHICYKCYQFINKDKQISEFAEPLLYKCIACDYTPVKRKRQEMYIGEDQNGQSQMCCKKCYGKAQYQQQRLHNKKQIQKLNRKSPVNKRGNNQVSRAVQQQRLKQKDQRQQVKSQIRQRDKPIYNTRQQSLPTTYDKNPINIYQYKPGMKTNQQVNEYGMRTIQQQRFMVRQQIRQKAQECFVCKALTFCPVEVDGMMICNGCKNSNKEELQKKQQEKSQSLRKVKTQKPEQNYLKTPNIPLNKQLYDTNKQQNEKQLVHPIGSDKRESYTISPKRKVEISKIKSLNQNKSHEFLVQEKPSQSIHLLSQNRSTTQSTPNQSSNYQRIITQTQVSLNSNNIILKCQNCYKQIKEILDLGVKNENGLVLCYRCNSIQSELLSDRHSFNMRSSPCEQFKGLQTEKSTNALSSGHTTSNLYISKFDQPSNLIKEVKPSAQTSKLSLSSQHDKTIQKNILQNKSIYKSPKNNLNHSQSLLGQAEPCFKIQTLERSEQSIIKKQEPTVKEEKKPTVLQEMMKKLKGQPGMKQDSIRTEIKQKVEKSESRIQNSSQSQIKLSQNIRQNSRLNQSVASRKSFQLPENAKIIKSRVQYSNILTQSMLQDDLNDGSFSRTESANKKQKSFMQKSMSLCFDPKEELKPTKDQPQQKPFTLTVSRIRYTTSKNVQDSKLNTTEFVDLNSIVSELDSSFKKSARINNLSNGKQKLEDEYVKQSFEDFSDEKPIKEQKLQVDLDHKIKIKLLNCTVCRLMIELPKGFMINQNNEIINKVSETNAPKMFLCQSCYYGQYFKQKHQLQHSRKSRLDMQSSPYKTTDRKSVYKSLKEEDDTKKRNRPTFRTNLPESKIYPDQQRMTTVLPQSKRHEYSGVQTPLRESKKYGQSERITTYQNPSQINRNSGAYGTSGQRQVTQANLDQMAFLEQKMAINSRKTLPLFNEVERQQQVNGTKVIYKSEIRGDEGIGKKKYICKKCNNNVTILCLDEDCLECFNQGD